MSPNDGVMVLRNKVVVLHGGVVGPSDGVTVLHSGVVGHHGNHPARGDQEGFCHEDPHCYPSLNTT